MAATCSLCARADEVLAALAVPGISQRAAAEALGISKTSMLRHLAHATTVSGTVQPVPVAPVVPVTAPPPVQARTVQAAPTTPVQAVQAATLPTVQAEPTIGLAAWGVAFAAKRAASKGPGRPCLSCNHPLRETIDTALARGVRFRAIERLLASKGHKLSDSAIRVHARECVPEQLAAAADVAAARDATTVETVRAEAEALMLEAKVLIEEARATDDLRARAACLTAAKGILELLARITGDLGADIEIRIAASPSYARMKAALIEALTPFPEAMAAAGAALVAAEGN